MPLKVFVSSVLCIRCFSPLLLSLLIPQRDTKGDKRAGKGLWRFSPCSATNDGSVVISLLSKSRFHTWPGVREKEESWFHSLSIGLAIQQSHQ